MCCHHPKNPPPPFPARLSPTSPADWPPLALPAPRKNPSNVLASLPPHDLGEKCGLDGSVAVRFRDRYLPVTLCEARPEGAVGRDIQREARAPTAAPQSVVFLAWQAEEFLDERLPSARQPAALAGLEAGGRGADAPQGGLLRLAPQAELSTLR